MLVNIASFDQLSDIFDVEKSLGRDSMVGLIGPHEKMQDAGDERRANEESAKFKAQQTSPPKGAGPVAGQKPKLELLPVPSTTQPHHRVIELLTSTKPSKYAQHYS